MRFGLFAPASLLIVLAASPAAASDSFWHSVADIGAIGIPLAAGGLTVINKDHNGLVQLAETGVVTLAATEALRYSIDSERPNGGSHSFPSLHTSAAFAGAGFIHARYGWQTGLPFELAAAAVGFARVQTKDHHWYDVVGGAAIGEGSAWLFTRRLRDDVNLSLAGDSHGGMISLAARF